MEASASSASVTPKFLEKKLRVGGAQSAAVNYNLSAKVFHQVDVPREKLEAKKFVQKAKKANILGTEKQEWNCSTIADPRIQKDVTKDLKRQLLEVRAGLRDERVMKPSKAHTDDKIAERYKYIVTTTGKGPIGKLTGKWFNPVDERGLAAHCIEDKWNDWNPSSSTMTKEDKKQAAAVNARKEELRKSMKAKSDAKLDMTGYVAPEQSISNINHRLRERKIDFQDLKEQFKAELKLEFPNASEERIQAMAQRLLNEKLLADEKMARFPIQNESFRPNLSLTTQDRRYKVYSHPGRWCWIEAEKRYGWSCCMNFREDGKGCECKIQNPDSWCLAGFERYHTG
jgi:hypothetical protein